MSKDKETNHLLPHYYTDLIEAGCDEAGRGCLAGSVYAAAVILPRNYDNPLLNDSKKLSEKKRRELRDMIVRDAVAWAVGVVTPEEIDKINILKASFLAMHRALDQLKVRPEAVIVDGNRFTPYQDLPYTTIVKVTESIKPLPQQAYLLRHSETNIWTGWLKSIHTTTGRRTRDIQLRRTARASDNTEQRHTIA